MSNLTLYINKINDSILFDEKNKEFTICDGSLGTYKFCDVVRSQIVYEHARYKGKSPLFSHRVLISTFNTSIFIELKKVYVGVEIELSNKGKAYVYISKNPVIQYNLQFEEDYKIAKQIDKGTLDEEVIKYFVRTKKHEDMVPTEHLEKALNYEKENGKSVLKDVMDRYFPKSFTLKREKRAGFTNALIIIYFVFNFGLFFAFLFLSLA